MSFVESPGIDAITAAKIDEYTGNRITFSKEARQHFLEFALSPGAAWRGNFRDLNAGVVRMATLARGGRISVEIVDEEIHRLQHSWADSGGVATEDGLPALIGDERLATLDAFDRVQLAHVIDVCRKCRSLSEAGRQLFSASRGRKASTNDADRLRKYLNRFGIEWSQISSLVEFGRGGKI
jgi:transcriptional regulatory protein RtcR